MESVGEAALIAGTALLASLLLCAHCTHPKRRKKRKRRESPGAGGKSLPQRSRLARSPKAKSKSAERQSRTHSHSTSGHGTTGGGGTAHSVDKRTAIAQHRRSRMSSGQRGGSHSADTGAGSNETQSAGRRTVPTGDESYEQLQSNAAASAAAAGWAEIVPLVPVPDCQPRTPRTSQRHRRANANAPAAAAAGPGAAGAPVKPAKPMPPLGTCDDSMPLGDGRAFLEGGRPLAKADAVSMPGDSRRGSDRPPDRSPRLQVLPELSSSHRGKAKAAPQAQSPPPPAQGVRQVGSVPKPQTEQPVQQGGGGAQAGFWKKPQPQPQPKPAD